MTKPTPALTPELSCTDIKASLAFYVGVLGFNVEYQRPEDGFAMLEREDSHLMLDEIRTTSVTGTDRTWLSGPMERPFGRGINLQMLATNVDRLYDQVRQAKANIFLPMEDKWYRAENIEVGNRQFIVQDPDGYLLRFAQDLGVRPIRSAFKPEP